MKGDQCKFDHGSDAVVLEDSTGAAPGVPPYQPAAIATPQYAEPYVPSGVALPPLHLPPPGYPSAENPRKRPHDGGDQNQSPFNRLGVRGANYRGGRGRGRGGRGGGIGGRLGQSGVKQLAVRNIPPNQNNIAHINNHFAKFGNLVNVQVQFEGDPASALVTFSTVAEAEEAFNSPDAVLGNRFIKMFYHYDRSHKKAKSDVLEEKVLLTLTC